MGFEIQIREIGLIDKKIISCLSVAGSKKTPLCYSKVKGGPNPFKAQNHKNVLKSLPQMEY